MSDPREQIPSDLRDIALVVLFIVTAMLCGCAATVDLSEPQQIAPGERMDVTADDAWRADGASLQTFADPFADAGDLRDPEYRAQFGER